MVYVVENSILQWGVEADSPEEAHAKLQGIAAMLLGECKKHPGQPNDPRLRRAVSNVIRGNFRAVASPDLKEAWSVPPRWAK
jgi:hypothetical protein